MITGQLATGCKRKRTRRRARPTSDRWRRSKPQPVCAAAPSPVEHNDGSRAARQPPPATSPPARTAHDQPPRPRELQRVGVAQHQGPRLERVQPRGSAPCPASSKPTAPGTLQALHRPPRGLPLHTPKPTAALAPAATGKPHRSPSSPTQSLTCGGANGRHLHGVSSVVVPGRGAQAVRCGPKYSAARCGCTGPARASTRTRPPGTGWRQPWVQARSRVRSTQSRSPAAAQVSRRGRRRSRRRHRRRPHAAARRSLGVADGSCRLPQRLLRLARGQRSAG
jgi:hypothetical protein